MKKLLLSLSILFSINCISQDSSLTKLTLNVQGRDAAITGIFVPDIRTFDDLYDTMKVKFRPPMVLPTPLQLVSVTATLGDWHELLKYTKYNVTTLLSGTYTRLRTLLLNSNDPYIGYRIFLSDKEIDDMSAAQILLGGKRYRKEAN